jgi:mannan endo-1,4-beta-mannosidase
MKPINLWITRFRFKNPAFCASFVAMFFFAMMSKAADIKLEAEEAVLSGVEIANSIPGYSGSGYAWGFDQEADNVLFNFPVAAAGKYEISVVYTSPYDNKITTIQLNTLPSAEQQFQKTDPGFNSLKLGEYELAAGQNAVRFTKNWGYYGIDYVLVRPISTTDSLAIKAEAESGILNGVVIATAPAGFSGSGYVNGFDNETDKLTIPFNGSAGLYELQIIYTSPFGEKGYDFSLNAETGSGMFANTGSSFGTVTAGKFLLQNGVNTFTINKGWGYFGIDYILLVPAATTVPIKPPKQLVDVQATQSTRALFTYLIDQYGTKTLSGQHDDTEYILQVTGKEPAIGGFDLVDYSPSRIEHGAQPEGNSEKYIAWAKKNEGNGIITLTWHWNAPTDLINQEPDKLWWWGFYTKATTFDLAAALSNKDSEKYKLLIRDIDVIAVQLKKFQDADVPVLWRPLHEAAGTWFWWGAKGPEAFKELWRILYDRLQNHHGLHNLIWVFTSDTNIDWYPGDAYVDMIGMDIYSNADDNMSGSWMSMMNMYGGRKLVSLSESGTLPVPDRVRGYGTWWSWFGIWNGSYIQDQPKELLNAVYNDEDVITRDELPDWRIYAQPTVAVTAATNSTAKQRQPEQSKLIVDAMQMQVYPNPAKTDYLTVQVYADVKQEVTLSLLNGNSQNVLTSRQHLQVGVNQIRLPLTRVNNGLYILLMQKGKQQVIKKIMVAK